jgi:hypothetical protein
VLLLLLLPILVAGFVILTKHPFYFYRLHRYDGQLLYLSSAYQGLLCTLVGAFIVFSLNKYFPSTFTVFSVQIPLDIASWLDDLLSPVDGGHQIAWMTLLTIAAIAVAYARIGWFRLQAHIKYGLNRDGPKLSPKTLSEAYLIRSILDDSPLDSLFCDSFLSQSPEKYLMLTMEDGKVYVGKVISLGEPTESEGMDQEIKITPFISGYRTKERLKVTFTTKYDEIEDDISLVLRQDKIISATIFDVDVYQQFQAQPYKSDKQESGAVSEKAG